MNNLLKDLSAFGYAKALGLRTRFLSREFWTSFAFTVIFLANMIAFDQCNNMIMFHLIVLSLPYLIVLFVLNAIYHNTVMYLLGKVKRVDEENELYLASIAGYAILNNIMNAVGILFSMTGLFYYSGFDQGILMNPILFVFIVFLVIFNTYICLANMVNGFKVYLITRNQEE